MTKVMIDRPRDPLAGMIASYRSAYAKKWRVPVADTEETAEQAPAASSAATDGFVEKIRSILGVRQ